MQLLLFLSALLAGLTGVVAGDRDVRAVQQRGDTAISRTAISVVEVADAAIGIARTQPLAAAPLVVTLARFALHAAPLAMSARILCDRRLE